MKLVRNFALILSLSAVAAGCDDTTDPDAIVIADLAGTYSVQTFEYEADNDSGTSLDLATVPAAQGGPLGIISMTVDTDGSFAGQMKLPVQGSVQQFPVGGDITLTGDNTMRIDFDAFTDNLGILDDFEDGSFTLDGDNLTLVLPNVTFDFTMSGAEPVDADLTIVASR